MKNNIPDHAYVITFRYDKRTTCKIYVWDTEGGKFQWSAAGNNGEAATQDAALSQAREWILNNYDPNSRQ